MIDTIGIVRRFHRAFEVPDGPPRPALPGWNEEVAEDLRMVSKALLDYAGHLHVRAKDTQGNPLLSRAQLMVEELGEVLDAMARNNVPDTLHEMSDQRVVNDGSLLVFGMARIFPTVFRAIDAANMSKLGPDGKPVKDASGRIIKGPNFKKADIRALLVGLGEIDP